MGIIALTVGLASCPALIAAAITGRTPDGEGHPNVGMIVFYDKDGRFRCSATLVSPTVILTAAHCTKGTLGKTLVRFDSVIAMAAPSPLPVAKDPANGYTDTELREPAIFGARRAPTRTTRTSPTSTAGTTSV